MFTSDLLRAARSEHEVYFLLTDYVETKNRTGKLACVPSSITELPLRGPSDLRERFSVLFNSLDIASRGLDNEACVTIKEAMEIFAAASTQLRQLRRMHHHLRCVISVPDCTSGALQKRILDPIAKPGRTGVATTAVSREPITRN